MRRPFFLLIMAGAPMAAIGAQPTTGRIDGRVLPPGNGVPLVGGEPQAGVSVVLQAFADTMTVRTVRTDAAGKFVIDSLPPDRYRLRVQPARHFGASASLRELAVHVRSGRTVRVQLLGWRTPVAADGSGCGERELDHPAGIERGGPLRPVANGAAVLMTLRPGEQGIKTQYALLDGCRPAPLSERGAAPPR